MCTRNYAVQAMKGVGKPLPPHACRSLGWVRRIGYKIGKQNPSLLICNLFFVFLLLYNKQYRKPNMWFMTMNHVDKLAVLNILEK